jgi:sterol desaturase/sphingolipid hydroxylase (fatty acid hydroxylase superfamily)
MSPEILNAIGHKLVSVITEQIPIMLGLAALFTVVTIFQSQASSPGKVWWRNPGLPTDISYAIIHSVIGPFFKIPAFAAIAMIMTGVMSNAQIDDYFQNGKGPLGGAPFWLQAVVYVIGSDFLLYWIHRGFHNASMWRFHAIHHSATQVDWTTTYRFHPINLMLQPALVTVIMMTLGISPAVMMFFLPFDILSAAWVHSNLNWTLGPLKYVIATPVFHRWHHGPADDGGSSNFAPTFAFWDYMFGTFHMPEGRLPEVFGTDDHHFPEGYFNQLTYPFKNKDAPSSADASNPAAAL